MTGTFAAGARRLSGQAALLLGWRPDEFWAATPDELAATLAPLGDMLDAQPPEIDQAQIAILKEMHPDE